MQAMQVVGMNKPGPQLGKLLSAVIDWQLVHPHGTADDCKQYMKQHWDHVAESSSKKR